MIAYVKTRHPVLFIISAFLLIIPAISFADAGRIFKENSRAVVVVVAYDGKGKAISQGSGFIIRADGAVVTNYHVISNARDIKIKAGSKVLKVEGLLYIDKENDLVILKANGKGLPTVKIGDIAKVNIGEKVYVISSPEGLENTVSDGILSGIREISQERKVLQITAPISPGSSGGPVFNKNGEVVGIATFLIKEAQNLNFAMPVDEIKAKLQTKKIISLKDSGLEDYKKTEEYWFSIGYYYGEVGMYREAIEAYKQAIRIKPDYARAHYGLGVAYGKSGMFSLAIEAYKQAIRIKPDDADAHNNLGASYVNLGMYREAIEAYKQAIRLKPDYAMAHDNLGNAYDKLGIYREAIEAFKQAIRIKPDYENAYNNLGNTYHNLSMYTEAIEAFKQAIKIKPDNEKTHYNLGFVYLKSGMDRDAIDSFKLAIRIKPNLAEAHHGLGIAYYIINDRGSALEEYKILKDLDPERANMLFNLIYK